MAQDPDDDPAKSLTSSAKSVHDHTADETTPLIATDGRRSTRRAKWPKSVIYRVLVTSFIVALSFGVTQVPLIYVFRVMTCEEYYLTHPLPPAGTPAFERRCNLPAINSGTAQSVALIGLGTTLFGVANLFITGWMIKAWGVKKALLVSVFWPAVRLLVQNIGVEMGAGRGIMVVQASQIVTIIGGPSGYLLSLNSFATEVVHPSERTQTLGRLSGVAMFGTALGYFSGGILADWFGIITPFRVTLILFCISTVWSALALPSIKNSEEVEKKATKSLGAFFEPLKMFTPRKWVLRSGIVRREYGVLLLGAGAFLAVFATGYIPTLLQMYSTDVFDFGATQNSELISLNFVIRAAFLTFAFPAIIDFGRARVKKNESARKTAVSHGLQRTVSKDQAIDDDEESSLLPTEPNQLVSAALPTGQATAEEPSTALRRTSTVTTNAAEDEPESFAFDLLYTRYSLLADGILTVLAAFTRESWHIYPVAAILPLAAGTGSAAKGTMLQMCTPEQRTDALSAISLLEAIARLSTISIFGYVFSAFVTLGEPRWTFVANAGCAIVGFVVLLFARFPPDGAVRFVDQPSEENDDGR